MTDDEINCNDEFDIISMDESDPILDYFPFPKSIGLDMSISFECKGFLLILWSLKDEKMTWEQKAKFVVDRCWRSGFSELFDEAINAGYINKNGQLKLPKKH